VVLEFVKALVVDLDVVEAIVEEEAAANKATIAVAIALGRST
jgi:hypothetical protein